MVTLRANEEWRKDPERIEKARKLCAFRADRIDKIIQALSEAQKYGNELYVSGERDVPSQALYLEKLERSYLHYSKPTETLIGNLAAFGEGKE